MEVLRKYNTKPTNFGGHPKGSRRLNKVCIHIYVFIRLDHTSVISHPILAVDEFQAIPRPTVLAHPYYLTAPYLVMKCASWKGAFVLPASLIF